MTDGSLPPLVLPRTHSDQSVALNPPPPTGVLEALVSIGRLQQYLAQPEHPRGRPPPLPSGNQAPPAAVPRILGVPTRPPPLPSPDTQHHHQQQRSDKNSRGKPAANTPHQQQQRGDSNTRSKTLIAHTHQHLGVLSSSQQPAVSDGTTATFPFTEDASGVGPPQPHVAVLSHCWYTWSSTPGGRAVVTAPGARFRSTQQHPPSLLTISGRAGHSVALLSATEERDQESQEEQEQEQEQGPLLLPTSEGRINHNISSTPAPGPEPDHLDDHQHHPESSLHWCLQDVSLIIPAACLTVVTGEVRVLVGWRREGGRGVHYRSAA
jgi:hypothetical protein